LRGEIHIPRAVRAALLGVGVLVFAIGSFVPNSTGGILALVSALLVIFLFFFTTSKAAGETGSEGREASRTDGSVPLVV
jgi:hypothetical protein